MAALRKAGAYSKKYARPYTRISKKRTQNFIKSTPFSKIVKFNMGKVKKFQDDEFDTIVKVIAAERVQIRDNALESLRQTILRNIEKEFAGQFYFEIRVYPHHILRENKMLTGAGSDRMQTGMQKSFGKVIGRAAMVKKDQEIALIAISGDKQLRHLRKVLKTVKPKLPCKVRISVQIKKK